MGTIGPDQSKRTVKFARTDVLWTSIETHWEEQLDTHHKKIDLKVFVIVITKQASLFWHEHRLFENVIYDVSRVKFWKFSVILKEGWAQPSFFWYDNDKDLKVCFLVTASACVFWSESPFYPHEIETCTNSFSKLYSSNKNKMLDKKYIALEPNATM